MGKMRFYFVCTLIVCVTVIGIISCGGGYPDISGDWEITAHCDPSQIGVVFTVTQDGPDFTVSIIINEEELEWNGTIDKDGNIAIDGEIDGEPMTITGQYDGGNTITLVADVDGVPCTVEAERQ